MMTVNPRHLTWRWFFYDICELVEIDQSITYSV